MSFQTINALKTHTISNMFSKLIKPKSEIRFDIINNDWVVIAQSRAKRPEDFQKKQAEQVAQSEKPCAFCDLFSQAKFKDKNIAIIPNKFPAFFPGKKITIKTEENFFQKMPAIGFHEVLVFKDHQRQLFDFSLQEFQELLSAYQGRYIELAKEKVVSYISIFHNQGKMAGASQEHLHSQIIAAPVFDADLTRTLRSSQNFFKEKGQCLFCSVNRAEIKFQKRIVAQNKDFAAICPFASKASFELVITPKDHLPYFEKISLEEKSNLAEIFSAVLKKISKGLNNPDYNFYLRTSPCDGREYPFYHWHFTIIPRTSIWAGFELGAKMEISTIEPEEAAKYLRKL